MEEGVTEISAGKINFEKVLQAQISSATKYYRTREFLNYTQTIQAIWDNCLEEDKRHIKNLVKDYANRNNPDSRTQVDLATFLRFVEANPVQRRHLLTNPSKINVWRRILALINQGLKERYYGKRRHYQRDSF